MTLLSDIKLYLLLSALQKLLLANPLENYHYATYKPTINSCENHHLFR